MLHERGAVSEDSETRPELAREGAHPEVRADTGGVLEREEDVVVDLSARPAHVHFGVGAFHGPEELERLVHEVAPEVEEEPARLVSPLAPGTGELRSPALEP